MPFNKLIAVEDAVADMEGIRRRHTQLQNEAVTMRTGVLPPLEVWSPLFALNEVASRSQQGANGWIGDELLLLDTWDRDALDMAEFGTTFFSLRILNELRKTAESHPDAVLPRVVMYSRAMQDDLPRAVLSEFYMGREEIEINRDSVTKGWRCRRTPAGAVVVAMFERSVMLENLLNMANGDFRYALAPPGPSSPIWDDYMSSSCFGSWHLALRDQFPDVWETRVLGTDPKARVNTATRTAIRRLALRYLEPSPRKPTWRGAVELARQMANPA